jgi:hypothetical protein
MFCEAHVKLFVFLISKLDISEYWASGNMMMNRKCSITNSNRTLVLQSLASHFIRWTSLIAVEILGVMNFTIIRTSRSIDSSKPQINANYAEEFQFPHHRRYIESPLQRRMGELIALHSKYRTKPIKYILRTKLRDFSVKVGGRSSSIQIKRAKICRGNWIRRWATTAR